MVWVAGCGGLLVLAVIAGVVIYVVANRQMREWQERIKREGELLLCWIAQANETAARSLYQVVLREARSEDEIETYLNPDMLRRLWPSLTLPRAVREFWEAQHPALAHG